MTTADAVDYHRKASWRLLEQADVELEQGEIEKASQALWDAAAHAVRAAAARRGWSHESTHDLMQIVVRLIEEEGGPVHLNTNLIIAHSFDLVGRAWDIPLLESEVRYCKGPVTELIRLLESMD